MYKYLITLKCKSSPLSTCKMLNKIYSWNMLVYNYTIFVYEHKTYQNYNNSRMALTFETRDIFWTPSLYQNK